jgi:hypothetical protein
MTTSLPADPARGIPFKEAIEDYLGISLKTGHALVNSRRLQTYTIGARRYVCAAELARFIAEAQANSPLSRENRAAKVKAATEASMRKRAAKRQSKSKKTAMNVAGRIAPTAPATAEAEPAAQ